MRRTLKQQARVAIDTGDYSIKDSKTKFLTFLMILSSMLICMFPETSFAADTLEGLGKEVDTLANKLQKTIGTVCIMGASAGALITGNIKMAIAILGVAVIIAATLLLNSKGMTLLG